MGGGPRAHRLAPRAHSAQRARPSAVRLTHKQYVSRQAVNLIVN